MNDQKQMPVSVFARRDVKGARRRVLAVQAEGKGYGVAWTATGHVDVYFGTADGMAHVVLPPSVVELIKRGPARPEDAIAQCVPRLDGPGAVKRFVLFASPDYYPAGGWGDFRGSFDTYAEARAAGEPFDKSGEACEIIDLQTALDVWK